MEEIELPTPKSDSKIDHYTRLMGVVSEGLTIHNYRILSHILYLSSKNKPKTSIKKVVGYWFRYSDLHTLLELPQNGADTVWQNLDVTSRMELVKALLYRFQLGHYDDPNEEDPADPGEIFKALRKMGQRNKISAKKIGIIPRLFCKASLDSLTTGVCRHKVSAMAGLLGELGVPSDDIAISRGIRKNPDKLSDFYFHAWLNIRLDSNDDKSWVSLDPTCGIPPTNPADKLLLKLFPREPNHKEIYEVTTEIPFLVPIPDDYLK